MTQDVVEIARTWIGTPYQHQASCKGSGTDCLGLIRGVWRVLHGREPVAVPGYTLDWSEPAKDEVLWRAAATYLLPQEGTSPVVPGDVLLFRMRESSVAKHLGIASERYGLPHFIHAYGGHAVVESALSRPWARRIVARFRFPQRIE